jgi:hypothetical protein
MPLLMNLGGPKKYSLLWLLEAKSGMMCIVVIEGVTNV